MSKLVCICGNVISNVHYPSPTDAVLLSEKSLYAVLAFAGDLLNDFKNANDENRRTGWILEHLGSEYPQNATDAEVIEDSLSDKINELAIGVVSCSSCGRLHIQVKHGANEYISYVPDTPC